MSRPSQVIVLVEDKNQQQLIYRFLVRAGLTTHSIRFDRSPPGAGSGEQWVRNQYANQVKAYRSRRSRADTRLIAMIDADLYPLADRLRQLENNLLQSGQSRLMADEQIAHLIAKRNIETWVLCLGGQNVNEILDYKHTQSDWSQFIRQASLTLYEWTRYGAQRPPNCIASLTRGIQELTHLNF